MADQTIVLSAGDTLTVTVAAEVAPEVIEDVKVENTDNTSETFVPEESIPTEPAA